LALLVAFGLMPAVYAIEQSVRNVDTGALSLENYTRVLTDFRFLPAVQHVAVFMVIWVPVMIGGTLLLALLLHQRVGRLSGVLRLVYFLPGAVTGSAAVLLWYCMLAPNLSPFAPALRALGMHSEVDVFTPGHLPWIFALVAFITGTGQWIVVMYGALQAIPTEIMEAAAIDGAGPIRTALQIKLPLIGKYVVFMFILAFAAALQIFIEPQLFYAITKSGSSWWSLNQLGYSFAFQLGDFAGAATISVLLLVFSTVAGLFLVYRTNFFDTGAVG
jgi:multiple sugar transport system permease protein